jgi:transposase
MYYRTFVGLDVHKSSISAAAFSPETGEIVQRKFTEGEVLLFAWLKSLDAPIRIVYESGFSGFALYRKLMSEGLDCCIAAISKLAKPSGDRVKTDRRDAIFLARQLACGNIVEVNVPSVESEGLRDISREREFLSESLTAAKHRVTQMCLRYGFTWNGNNWTLGHFDWLHKLRMPTENAQTVLDRSVDRVLRLQNEKKALDRIIGVLCEEDPVKTLVDRLCLIKGIGRASAFCIVVEIEDFKRFRTAAAFASYLGLVPSENSSGSKVRRGKITRTGNDHVRKTLVEASWCMARMKTPYKTQRDDMNPQILEMARVINRRLLKRRTYLLNIRRLGPCSANIATARELAQAIWALVNAKMG